MFYFTRHFYIFCIVFSEYLPERLHDEVIGFIIPFLTVGYIKKGEKCLFKGVFLPFKIVVWEASYEIFLIFLLSSLG